MYQLNLRPIKHPLQPEIVILYEKIDTIRVEEMLFVEKKSKKSTMNNTVTSKYNPLKNAQATDSDNLNLGNSRGGEDPSHFTRVKSSRKNRLLRLRILQRNLLELKTITYRLAQIQLK